MVNLDFIIGTLFTILSLENDMELLFYTVNLCNYDRNQNIIGIRSVLPQYDFVCVTDNPRLATSMGWKVHEVHIQDFIKKNRNELLDLTRYFKMNPKALGIKSDINIYFDSNKYITNISKVIEFCRELYASNKKMTIASHWGRDNVKDECDAVVKENKAYKYQVEEEYSKLIKDGFKDDVGLFCASIEIRKTNSYNMKHLLELWWDMYKNSPSKRDQITLPYCIWKTNMINKINTITSSEILKGFKHMGHKYNYLTFNK